MTDDVAANWVPPEVDVGTPSASRMYDYLLGGAHNFEVDRRVAQRVIDVQPNIRDIARNNRAFLHRAVRYLVDNGVRQFLDLGSGIPTVGNVHEIAQAAAPGSRVVYVDIDEVAVAHSRLLLADDTAADIVFADVTEPDTVLHAARTTRLFDFDQPVGILAITMGHYISPEADPYSIFAHYRDATASGSFLAVTHATDDFANMETDEISDAVRATGRDNYYPRTRAEVTALFAGYELVEPGVVTTSQWHPQPGLTAAIDPAEDGVYAGVGRKP